MDRAVYDVKCVDLIHFALDRDTRLFLWS